ncbi:MAG: DUF4058 family protein [Stenomitos frigidus ULC029]
MPSPFPGMNPYLETPELWSEFHSRMIVAIADGLDDLLSRAYRVAVEKRVYLSQDEETVLIGIPDVAVTTAKPAISASTMRTAVAEPLTVELPASAEVQERYLEIREGGTGIVITTIELLSPKNKRSGEGRNAYLQKRQQTLSTTTHWVEIDLLRGGESMPMLKAVRSDYRVLVSRSQDRPQAQLYAFSLRQLIPPLPMPLRPGETEPLLELQPLLQRVYDRARFELAIDYRQPPTPKLSHDDWEWLQSFLRNN